MNDCFKFLSLRRSFYIKDNFAFNPQFLSDR